MDASSCLEIKYDPATVDEMVKQEHIEDKQLEINEDENYICTQDIKKENDDDMDLKPFAFVDVPPYCDDGVSDIHKNEGNKYQVKKVKIFLPRVKYDAMKLQDDVLCSNIQTVGGVENRLETGRRRFKCGVCKKEFKRSYALTSHMRVHTGETPFKCGFCKKEFKQSSTLTVHVRLHTGETPFKCSICGKEFKQSGGLTVHMRHHSGENPYKCNVCKKGFKEHGILKRHLGVHTGETPFKCIICKKGFKQRSNLTSHIRVHIRETPFKCAVCKIEFATIGALTVHVRAHTGETNELIVRKDLKNVAL